MMSFPIRCFEISLIFPWFTYWPMWDVDTVRLKRGDDVRESSLVERLCETLKRRGIPGLVDTSSLLSPLLVFPADEWARLRVLMRMQMRMRMRRILGLVDTLFLLSPVWVFSAEGSKFFAQRRFRPFCSPEVDADANAENTRAGRHPLPALPNLSILHWRLVVFHVAQVLSFRVGCKHRRFL